MPNAKRQTPNPNSALDPFLQFIKKRKKEKKKTSLLLQIIFMWILIINSYTLFR